MRLSWRIASSAFDSQRCGLFLIHLTRPPLPTNTVVINSPVFPIFFAIFSTGPLLLFSKVLFTQTLQNGLKWNFLLPFGLNWRFARIPPFFSSLADVHHLMDPFLVCPCGNILLFLVPILHNNAPDVASSLFDSPPARFRNPPLTMDLVKHWELSVSQNKSHASDKHKRLTNFYPLPA